MKKQQRMWNFKKVDGKWESELNPEWLFYMETTHGVPHELVLDEIENLSSFQRLESKLKSWKQFSKENDIDLEPIRKYNEENKIEGKEAIKELLKTL